MERGVWLIVWFYLLKKPVIQRSVDTPVSPVELLVSNLAFWFFGV